MTPLRLLAQIEAPPAPPVPPLEPVGQAPMPPPDIPPELLAWLQTIPPQAVLLVASAVVAGALMVLYPLARALARRLEGGANIRELRAEVEAMRHRLAEVDEGGARIADLEERLDFSERILAQVQRERIPGGRHDA